MFESHDNDFFPLFPSSPLKGGGEEGGRENGEGGREEEEVGDHPLGGITSRRFEIVKVEKGSLTEKKIRGIRNELTISKQLKGVKSLRTLVSIKKEDDQLFLVYQRDVPLLLTHQFQETKGIAQSDGHVSLLQYILDKGRIQEEEAKVIFEQIAAALHSCHQRNVSMRDLKLPSILIHPQTKLITLVDFSQAMILSKKDDKTKERVGSPGYVSPEILSGNPYSPQKADSWSLGVILYTMVFGKLPFNAPNPRSLFQKIQEGKIPFPPSLSSSLSKEVLSLLQGLLEKDPSRRFSSSLALAHPWVANPAQDQLVPDF